MQSNLITTHAVTRSFSDTNKRGVFDVSFSARKGEIVCILGPSGSGKSTLLRILAGLEKIDTGILSIDTTIKKPGGIVYVPQDYTLWPHLSVLENLVLGPREVNDSAEHELREEALSLLSRFSLREYALNYPHELSGGQKQRVALMRALMMRPSVLLLDEVTSALDPELTKSVLDMIRALAKDGYTMLVVTHHLTLALAIADRILFLDNGAVVQDTNAFTFFNEQTNTRIRSFIQDIAKKDRTVEIFEGTEQFQAYHMTLLKRLPEKSIIHVAGAVGDRWFEPMGEFAQAYTKLRVRKKIVWKMAMSEFGTKDRELLKRYPDVNDFCLMPRNLRNPANYNVMGDTVIIQIFGEKPTIMEIRDSAVAESYRQFFEEMWRVSTPVEK